MLREHIAIAREQNRGQGQGPVGPEIMPGDAQIAEKVAEFEAAAAPSAAPEPVPGPSRGSKRLVSPTSKQSGTPSKKR